MRSGIALDASIETAHRHSENRPSGSAARSASSLRVASGPITSFDGSCTLEVFAIATRRNQRQAPTNPALPVAAVVVVVVAMLAVVGMRKPKGSKLAATIAASETPEVKTTATQTSPPLLEPSDSEIRERRKLALLEASTGFSSVRLPVDGDDLRLPVRLTIQQRCGAGDVDMIERVLAKRSRRALLLSVEEIGPGKRRVLGMQDLDVEALTDGKILTFPVDRPSSALPLAVYLCSDASRKRSCSGKAAVSFSTVGGKFASVESASDVVFYAQSLIADKYGVAFPNAAMRTAHDVANAGSYLAGRGLAKGDRDRIVRTMKTIADGTASQPLWGKSGEVQLILSKPRTDGACVDPLMQGAPGKTRGRKR